MADKGRYWSFIGYPESLPEDYLDRLVKQGLPVIISPLHDRDISEKTGEIEKPHKHYIVDFYGGTTLSQAQKFAEIIGFAGYVERIRSIKNAIDYLSHSSLTSKNKVQYDKKQISYVNSKESDWQKINYRRIIEYIDEHKINQFHKLCKSLIYDNEDELLEYVSSHSYYVYSYLSSLKIDIDKDIADTYNMLKGIAGEIDLRGKITLDKKTYDRLLEVFEQLDIFGLEDI